MIKEKEEAETKEQKTIREKKPIKTRYLIATAITVIFMIASMIMMRAPEKNNTANIPSEHLNQSESNQIIEEDKMTIENIKDETEAWMERIAVPRQELVSDLKGVDVSMLGPDKAYLAMRKEFEKVKDMGDFMAFIEIYGSDKNIKALEQVRIMIALISSDAVTEAIKTHFAEDIKSAEIITSSKEKAVIKVVSEAGKEGEATMVFERGSWRFDSEKW